MRKKYPLQIIYEDDFILVCDKPAGFPVQTAKSGTPDLVSQLKVYRQKKGEHPYVGLIHRLDQPVRGLIVFAKTPAMTARLSEQIARRTAQKEYLAVVCPAGILTEANPSISSIGNTLSECPINSISENHPVAYPTSGSSESTQCNRMSTRQNASEATTPFLPANGELRDYLLRDGRTNTSRVVPKGTPGAKEAVLSYDVLQTSAKTGRSLVRIHLHTGRHHQIRVQFAHAGFPLYADSKYGQPLPKGTYCPVALCSYKIGFHHPETGKWLTFTLDDIHLTFMHLL